MTTTTGVAKTIIHCIDAILRTNETLVLRNRVDDQKYLNGEKDVFTLSAYIYDFLIFGGYMLYSEEFNMMLDW